MDEGKRMQGLEFIRPLTWKEVFGFWRTNEADNPGWIQAAKDHGFDSWEEWRGSYVSPLKLDAREWSLYRVSDPMATVPTFRGGPFRAWIERIYGDAGTTPTFDIVAARLAGMKHGGVRSLMASFPKETVIAGIRTADGVIILEGMHRCSAIALAKAEGATIETDLMVALGEGLPDDQGILASIIGGHRKSEPLA